MLKNNVKEFTKPLTPYFYTTSIFWSKPQILIPKSSTKQPLFLSKLKTQPKPTPTKHTLKNYTS